MKTTTTSSNLQKGQSGENLAAAYLEKKGWRIAERNWRGGRGEIDIIAWEAEKILVFVEVKTRSGDGFGGPERGITAHKRKVLARTAGLYMESIDYDWEIRFDVVAVVLRHGRLLDLRHIEDAFYPNK